MESERATPSADRCPNCHAFLPVPADGATHRRCDYCGVAVKLERPSLLPPAPAPTPSPAPLTAPTPHARSGSGIWVSLLAPLLVGGSIYWTTQQSVRRAIQTTPSESRFARSIGLSGASSSEPTQAGHDEDKPIRSDGKTRPAGDSHRRTRMPVGDASLRNELCHISGMEMSAVVSANRARAATCFDRDLASFPKNVGLTSDWEIELDGLGHVHSARGRLHLLDFQRSPEDRQAHPVALPTGAALRCIEDSIRGWSFPKYSPKDGARMRMRCSFNLVIKDL